MLQVRKFNGRKGSKKKLAWTAEAEESFKMLKQTLLGKLRLFGPKSLCSAPMHRIMPLEQSWSK